MPDTAHFDYQGNATLGVGKGHDDATVCAQGPRLRALEIRRVAHLIPIQVHCTQGGDDLVVSAYMDYATNTVHLPPSSTSELDDAVAFKAALAAFVQREVLPRDAEPSNLTPDEAESVQGVLDANGARTSRWDEDEADDEEDD